MGDLIKAVKALNNSKIFSTIAAGLGFERIGLEITEDGHTLASFTSYNENGKITKVAEGLDNVAFTTSMEKSVFDEITHPKEIAWMEEHPVLAIKKYLTKLKMPLGIKLKIGKLFLQGVSKD